MNQRQLMLSALAIALISNMANSATPTTHSGSGLLMMPTAEVLKSGEDYFSLNIDHRSYIVSGSSANNSELQVTPGYLIGIADRFELGISATLAQDISAKNNALRNIIGTGKFQLVSPSTNGMGVALSAYSTLHKADVSDNIGSKDTNYGTEINLTWLGEDVSYHLSLGGGKTDIKTTSPSISYFSDSFVSASIGIEIKPAPNLSISVEANANRKNDLNNIVLMPGMKYTSNNNHVYSLGIGYGIPDNRAEPAYRIMAGVSFGLGKHSTATAGNRTSNFEQQLLAVDNRVAVLEASKPITTEDDNLQMKLNALENRVNELAASQQQTSQMAKRDDASSSTALRVKIINTSGIDALVGKIVAEKPKRSNYRVIQLTSDPPPYRKKTYIYYRKGLSRSAAELGHTLPGNQITLQLHKIFSLRYKVSASADLIVLIGTDLESLLK